LSAPVEVFSRKCAAFRTYVTVWPLDSGVFGVANVTVWPLDSGVFGVARCKLGPVLTVCSSCFVSSVDAALHTIQSAVYTYHMLMSITKSVVLTNTKFQQSELEADTYTVR
jgi:hypothetical protein